MLKRILSFMLAAALLLAMPAAVRAEEEINVEEIILEEEISEEIAWDEVKSEHMYWGG